MTTVSSPIAFAQRPPTATEFAKFRLLFSTFQDGTGMLAVKNSRMTLPGWRDFERAISLAFDGIASESKDVIDVRLLDPARPGVFYGILCKMRGELDRARRDGRITIELSNASRTFWGRLRDDGIVAENHLGYAPQVGSTLIRMVTEWHTATSITAGGDVDLAGSCYLALMWNRSGEYQLYQFPINLPDPASITWYYPLVRRKGILQPGKAVCGNDDTGRLFEWYGQSGGQLKYYPKVSDATWQSDVFRLEPLPTYTPDGLIAKAASYYPNLWPA